MDKKTQERIQRFQRRMLCELTECGQYATITASQDYLDHVASDRQVYSARCARCGSSFTLKNKELDFFRRHFGAPKLQALSTTFSTLFDEQ